MCGELQQNVAAYVLNESQAIHRLSCELQHMYKVGYTGKPQIPVCHGPDLKRGG